MYVATQQQWLRTGLALLLVAALSLALATPALAAEVIDGSEVYIGADEVIDDDLILTGESVVMDGTVKGDLMAFGQFVEINGRVEGNLITGGSNVKINGEVLGSVFAGGAEVLVSGTVNGSVYIGGFEGALLEGANVGGSTYFGGYSFDTESETQIARGLYVGGYQLLVAGDVGQDLAAGLGAFELRGTVGGDVNVEYGVSDDGAPPPSAFYGVPITRPVPKVAPGVDLSQGTVGGEIDLVETVYETPDVAVELSPEAVREARRSALVAAALNRLRERVGEFIGLLLVAVLVLWLAREPFMRAAAQLQAKPGASFLWGFGSLVALPFALLFMLFVAIAVVILVSFVTLGELTGVMMTLSGTTFGAVILAVTILAYLVGKVLVGYVAGSWLIKQMAPSALEGRYGSFWAILVGVLLFELLRAVPFFGWLLGLVVVSFGFGAIVSRWYEGYRANRTAVEAVA